MSQSCRGCGAELPAPFLDLGPTPLANAYLDEADLARPEPTYRLAVAYCPACHLAQLTDLVPPEELFTEYAYFSSFSSSFLEHARSMAQDLSRAYGLGPSSKVLEIASNDGYLLRFFQELGIPVLGVEPARNIAAEAQRRGVPTLNEFFGGKAVSAVLERLGQADLVVANNVFAHVPTPHDFLSAIGACLAPRGVAVLEFPEIGALLDKVEFDTIYHEHVFYFSLHAVKNLVERAGLELLDASIEAVHGQSLRVHLQHPGVRPVSPRVAARLAEETAAGLTSPERYQRFSRVVDELRASLVAMLKDLKARGQRLAAYGAPAKGNTLLNTSGIGRELLEFTVDRSPHKQGRYLPGSRLPILPPEALLERMPDVAVLLPWNLAGEIVAQQQEYLRRGGRFLVPIPSPRLVGSEDA